MIFGEYVRKPLAFLTVIVAALGLLAISPAAMAQELTEPVEAAPDAVTAPVVPAFEYYGSDMIKGQPTSAEDDILASMTFQDQYNANGDYALWMHDAILMPVITAISIFVLFLLLWVVFRYNRKANTVPSKTSHNTLIEIIWTAVPVLILVVIAVPSITLLARQYESPPEDAVTIKANGYQWYWGYEYVDNGGFEVISNMMPEADAIAQGLPPQLAVDNRMVVPAGVPIRIQTYGADVIHAFGIPSLWFKMDAVPGRINEKMLMIDEPGIYYGQCMELCGARHGYMPIAIEARPLDEFQDWVRNQPGGTVGGDQAVAAADPASSAPTEEGAEVDAVPAA